MPRGRWTCWTRGSAGCPTSWPAGRGCTRGTWAGATTRTAPWRMSACQSVPTRPAPRSRLGCARCAVRGGCDAATSRIDLSCSHWMMGRVPRSRWHSPGRPPGAWEPARVCQCDPPPPATTGAHVCFLRLQQAMGLAPPSGLHPDQIHLCLPNSAHTNSPVQHAQVRMLRPLRWLSSWSTS